MGEPCTYCGADVETHDPVYVSEQNDDGERTHGGQFCNYACLSEYIDAEDLTDGAACEWRPDSDCCTE